MLNWEYIILLRLHLVFELVHSRLNTRRYEVITLVTKERQHMSRYNKDMTNGFVAMSAL
jgi:hypothetical protein